MTTSGGGYRTSNDLTLAVLKKFGVLAPGQSADVEDVEFISEDVDSAFRALAALEICDVPDENNIPGEWFLSLADIVAGLCAHKFAYTGQDLTDIINRGLGGVGGVPIGAGTGAMAIKIMSRGRPTGEPQRTESF